ncbi:LOW QUALITY PROTEIN: uncharacterized protein LOC124288998 [Haliotis rubra]|uniref:LOW QUALITY PROTEIN: uncharacterized protein LOC124288998 n=1 Tax=Haliotis rubra TaxID=36100 RepID=UPI001EE5A5D3|nr:LOW QUALITY PROTEIN: uncharacterized protein LOC124288998 [Haliotis rubra]
MGTLYECLREARLEKYYPTFRANGITRSETLSRLSLHDCTVMGITSVDDRRRMTELINIIKSVHNASRTQISDPQLSSNISRKTSQPRRASRSPNPAAGQSGVSRGLEATRDVTVTDRTPNFSAASYVDMLQLLTESSSDESSDEAVQSDEQNIPRHVARPSTVSKQTRGQVERVKHTGYNYGVPKGTLRTKSKPASSTPSRGVEDRIRVCVRKRPVSHREERHGDDDILQTEGTNSVVVNEPKQAVDLTAFTLQHEFFFDEVFDENCSNEDVYVRAARPLINSVFNNGSATCFAYGQTGAGKTHTMMGNENVPGLYLLASTDIFSIIESKQYGDGLHVWVSFFEIYCGQLFDLLNRRNRLHAREDGSNHVCIAGLMETEVSDVAGLVKVLDYGNSVRSKGATGVNPDSSRSHAILQLEIRDNTDHRVGRISFIDLAGSELAADVTDTDRQTRLEGAEINQSLLALKECIRSIDQSSRHKPFRQSKLTHILKDSFVGNSRTCMIANISPTMSACENTLNTLRYADRVKELKRDGSRGTTSSQAENLLMNIPISAPSVFHPSNILSCSTPMRPVTRHTAQRPQDENILDPTDSPVRGHFPQKKNTKSKTPNIAQSSSVPKQSVSGTHDVSPSRRRISRPSREPSPARDHILRQNIPPRQLVPAQQTSSPSGSDKTDSESCNITLPRNNNLPQPNIPVAQSTDTEFDFPTSDFNVPEELNDLNKTGEKKCDPPKSAGDTGHGMDKTQGVSQGLPKSSGRMLPETPMVGKMQRSQSTDLPQQQDRVPDQGQHLMRQIPRSNSPATRRPHSAAAVAEAKAAGGAMLPLPTPSVSAPVPYAAVPTITPLVESIEDDQLFDNPSERARQPVVRSDSIASPQTKNGLSRLNGGSQLSVIPAVLPASSSDLSFTQRAPVRPPADMQGILLTPRAVDIVPSQQPHEPHLVVSDVSDIPEPHPVPPPPSIPYHRDGSPKHDSLKSDLPLRSSLARERRTRHASHSSQSSDDSSMEGARTSQSDSAQGPYKVRSRSKSKMTDLRKEKSDPMIALHMQTKKQTLPNPDDFHKYLSRGNTPKAGRPASSPMSVPLSKLSSPEAVPSQPVMNILSESEQTEVKSGRSSPAARLMSQDLRRSPVTFDKHAAGDGKSSVKSKSRMSVADVLKTTSRGERAKSPKDSTATHGVSSGNQKQRSSHAVQNENSSQTEHTDNRQPRSRQDNISMSSKSDSSQQSSFNSELLGKNIQTTTGSFVVRNSNSPTGAKSSSSVIVTEKLTVGAVFSPIHPQPITSHAVIKTISPTSPAAEVVQPKPVTPMLAPPVSASVAGSVTGSVAMERQSIVCQGIPLDDKNDPRSRLIMSHEDQLASVTSLCKQEMKLLLSAKSGHRSFEDYLRKLGDILSHKMSVMQQLQTQISDYCSAHGIQRRSVSQSSTSTIRSHQQL